MRPTNRLQKLTWEANRRSLTFFGAAVANQFSTIQFGRATWEIGGAKMDFEGATAEPGRAMARFRAAKGNGKAKTERI
jgi:hypothetical protein